MATGPFSFRFFPMLPGTYHFPGMTRGDTFPARAFVELARDGAPLEVIAARMEVRHQIDKRLLLAWDTANGSLVLSGDPANAIALGEKDAEAMAAVPEGTHAYDLQVTLAGGAVATVLNGKFPIFSDITQPA